MKNTSTHHRWIVETHLGNYETVAPTSRKALANIKWRIFGGRGYANTECWKVRLAD